MGFKPDPQQPAAAPVSTGRFRPDPPALTPTPSGGPRRYSAKNETSYLEEYDAARAVARQNAAEASEASSIPKALQPVVSAAEGALSLASGAVAPVPGAVKAALSTLTGSPVPYTEARDSYVYEPRSLPGQATMGTIGAIMKPVTDAFEGVSGGVENFAEFLGASPETAEQIAAPVMDIGTAAIPTRVVRPKKPPLKVESSATPEGKAKLAEMRAKGIKVTPKEAAQITGDRNYVGRALQAIGGESKITKDMAAKNAPVLNEMARKAVGSDSLTEGGLKPVKDYGNAVYDEMAGLGAVEPQQALFDSIESARGSASKSTKRNTEIDQFVDGVLAEYQSGAVDAGQIVNRVRELRRDAQNSRKGEGDKRPTVQQEALGEAQRKVADALDDFLEYQAALSGKPELAQKYKENRTRLAKVGTVESATRAGNVNAKQLYDAAQRGAPLSGNLKGIADAHEYAPGSTSPSAGDSLMDAPGRNLSLMELPVAAVQAAARHLGVNKVLQSEWYQSLLGGPSGGPIPFEHDPNPDAFRPPMRRPEPAPVDELPQTNASSMLRAQQLAGDLSLADDVPNPQQLPAAPDRLTADVPPAPGGDLNFEPQDLGALIESVLSAQTPPAQGSLPGGNVRGIASALGLAEDAPVNAGPARRAGPDDGIPFEQVNPEDVGPYRVNTDMNFNDARPLAGVQRGAAMDTGDLELLPDQPPGPYEKLPPSPGKPKRGGPPRIRQAAPAAPSAQTAPPLDEGLSELGALIDQMLSTPNPRAQMQMPAQLQQAQAGVVPGTKRVTGYRGVPEGVDPFDTSNTHGNALFFTPDEATARTYGNNVASRELEFSNLLQTPGDTLEAVRQALGLADSAELLDIIAAARSAGHDGVTYDLKPGREYIQIPRKQ